MKFALTHGNIGRFANPADAIELAEAAEAARFESIWTIEHVILPTEYQPLYPETPDGRIPFAPDHPITDPLIWMAFVAARTSQVKLGTGVLVLPQRNALITAKEVASLDRLSGGRVILGVGAGWLQEEFQALGSEFETRGKRLDEHIAAMRELWAGRPAVFDGTFSSFDGVVSSPGPHLNSVPVHIGGFTMPAAKRAGRIGDGFFPGGYDRDWLGTLIQRCRTTALDCGRDPNSIEITTRWTKNPDELGNLDVLYRLQDMGVDRVTIPSFLFDDDDFVAALARFGESVIDKF